MNTAQLVGTTQVVKLGYLKDWYSSTMSSFIAFDSLLVILAGIQLVSAKDVVPAKPEGKIPGWDLTHR